MAQRRWHLQLVLACLAAVIGVMAITIAKSRSPQPMESYFDSGNEAEILDTLLMANDSLRDEIERLDRQIAASQSSGGPSRLEEMASALNTMRLVNGAVAAVGPGIEVQIRGEFSAAAIRDLLNELKSAGAEVIAINGRRLTIWSSVYQGEEGVLVDGYLLGHEATIAAIGDVGVLKQALERRGGLIALLAGDGVAVAIMERAGADEIRVPIYREAKVFRYAHMISPGD